MINRRHALKTIAGATVVGSLSGCVQLATQQTTHFHGTPAMAHILAGDDGSEILTANAVSVEAQKTIERFGVTKEIVTHNWGMLYSFNEMDITGGSQGQVTMTFTTPSIEIAGRELNPIADLTVGKIGHEFVRTWDKTTGGLETVTDPTNVERSMVATDVENATGEKVLSAFRDALGSPSAEYQPPSLDASASGGTFSTVPDWDGDTYHGELTVRTGGEKQIETTWRTVSGTAGDMMALLKFDKHDGDFVVLFEGRPEDSDFTFVTPDLGFANATVLQGPETGTSRDLVHPTDDQFSQEMLQRHFIDTNLRGMQGLVEQSQNLIDETQNLLTEARNDTRDEEDDRFSVISNTQDDLKRLDTVMGGLAEGLLSISTKTVTTDENGDWSANIERAQTATEIATRAHDRVASYNDTRDEEDDRFVAIERNLSGIKRLANTVGEAIEYLENNAKDD